MTPDSSGDRPPVNIPVASSSPRVVHSASSFKSASTGQQSPGGLYMSLYSRGESSLVNVTAAPISVGGTRKLVHPAVLLKLFTVASLEPL